MIITSEKYPNTPKYAIDILIDLSKLVVINDISECGNPDDKHTIVYLSNAFLLKPKLFIDKQKIQLFFTNSKIYYDYPLHMITDLKITDRSVAMSIYSKLI